MSLQRTVSFVCRQCSRHKGVTSSPTVVPVRQFAMTRDRRADDPASGLAELLRNQSLESPLRRPTRTKPSTRDPNVWRSSSADAVKAMSKPDRPSSASANAPTDRSSAPASRSISALPPDNSEGLFRDIRAAAGLRPSPARATPAERMAMQRAAREAREAMLQRRRDMEQMSTRNWRQGDVYAPRDLSPAAMRHRRAARSRKAAEGARLRSRRHGGRDVLDELGINPVKEYKNFALMNDFVSDLGRIESAHHTGLRAINQRRAARAVRRAHGMGLMPTSYRHPELQPEQVAMRQTPSVASRLGPQQRSK